MATKLLNPRDVHSPAGPYSHTALVPAGAQVLFISGQVGMRSDGSIPAGFAEQAEVTFENLRGCLAAHGLGVDAVVKLGVFVLPGQDFQRLRAIREKHFGAHRPTSTTVYVPQVASPAFLLEVEAVAAKLPPAASRGAAPRSQAGVRPMREQSAARKSKAARRSSAERKSKRRRGG